MPGAEWSRYGACYPTQALAENAALDVISYVLSRAVNVLSKVPGADEEVLQDLPATTDVRAVKLTTTVVEEPQEPEHYVNLLMRAAQVEAELRVEE